MKFVFKGISAQIQQRIESKEDKNTSSSCLTAIKRLADYCKQYSVMADIVMDTDEQINTHPDKRYWNKLIEYYIEAFLFPVILQKFILVWIN